MSNEQKEKLKEVIHDVLLPLYRTVMIALLGMVSFFVTRVYVVVMTDHDKNIQQESRLQELEKLPGRVDNIEAKIVEIRIKANDKAH